MLGLYGGSVWFAIESTETRIDVSKWLFSCQNISVVFVVFVVLVVLKNDANYIRSFDYNHFINQLLFQANGYRGYFASYFKSAGGLAR